MNDSKWHKGSLLQLSGSFWRTCTLHAGVNLNIFTIIGDDTLSGIEIAEKAGCNDDALCRLLDALAAMELLEKDGEEYRNTPAALKHLSKDSEDYIGFMILHHKNLIDSWTRLDRAALTGVPLKDAESKPTVGERENFLMGMYNTAKSIAPIVAETIDLKGRFSLLDLGGGPGTYSIFYCKENPDLKAKVFDLPTTGPFAEKIIKQYKMEERVSFMGGNYLKDPIPGKYDVIWLSHILHQEGYDDCRKLIEKAVSCLEPGGIIMIHDFVLNENRTSPEFAALFSLNMLVRTKSGRSYTEKEISGMLENAGIKKTYRIPIRTPNDSGIVAGTI